MSVRYEAQMAFRSIRSMRGTDRGVTMTWQRWPTARPAAADLGVVRARLVDAARLLSDLHKLPAVTRAVVMIHLANLEPGRELQVGKHRLRIVQVEP